MDITIKWRKLLYMYFNTVFILYTIHVPTLKHFEHVLSFLSSDFHFLNIVILFRSLDISLYSYKYLHCILEPLFSFYWRWIMINGSHLKRRWPFIIIVFRQFLMPRTLLFQIKQNTCMLINACKTCNNL